MGCCSMNEKSVIVTTINHIWCSHPVHPGTKILTFVALKARKTQTKQLAVLIFNQVYFSFH